MPWLLQMIETRKSDGSKLVRGERDYLIFCGACHGLDRKGNLQAGFPPLLGIGERKTRAEIELITRQGGGRMPGYAVMPDGKRKAILDSLKRRALKLRDTLNTMEGVSCADVQGAMYAFPSITLPPKAVAAAEADAVAKMQREYEENEDEASR